MERNIIVKFMITILTLKTVIIEKSFEIFSFAIVAILFSSFLFLFFY